MINRDKFSFNTVNLVGIQLITLLEQIHSIGYIYNDLKPDNICIGEYDNPQSLNKLKLIDFGLATSYLKLNAATQEMEHLKCERRQFQGNLAFSSKNAFMEMTLSRRDDLISLVYMLTYLASGKLPFIKHNIPLIDQVPRIK